ncbi:MAG: HNH endonuclease [Beijerinckiaceae bacterium]
MPSRGPRICSCGKTVQPNERCPCQRTGKIDRDRRHDATRPNATQRGYGSKWREAREEFIRRNPVCAFCGAPSTVVDHIEPHKGDLKLFWRRSNWQALCASCHNSRKQRIERSRTFCEAIV